MHDQVMVDETQTLTAPPPIFRETPRKKLLVAIHGSHGTEMRMQAQRDTWLRDLEGVADHKFFLGLPSVKDVADVVPVLHPDGPLWDPTEPSRRTTFLNRKTEALVQYALDHDYDYVFKCDDDTYCHVGRLLACGFEEHDYMGGTECHWTADNGPYRWAQGGAGYFLSRRAMMIIAENGLRLIDAEDFAVGQLLAIHGIHPRHDDRFINLPEDPRAPLPEKLSEFITLHKVSIGQMHELYANPAEFGSLSNQSASSSSAGATQ